MKDINSPKDIFRYSKFVSFSKITLSLIAICLIFSVIIIPWFSKINDQFSISAIVQDTIDDIINNQMVNPSFQGVDNKGNPYIISADKAVQKNSTDVYLNNIKADINTKNESWLSIESEKGKIDISKQNINFLGNFDLFSHNGYEFHGNNLFISFKEGMAHSDFPIQMSSEPITMLAQGFTSYESGRVIDFKGPVNIKIYPINKRKN